MTNSSEQNQTRPDQPPRRRTRRGLWLLAGVLALAAAGAYWAQTNGLLPTMSKTESGPLTADLDVVLRQPGAQDMVALDEQGALPARAGGWMSLQVRFNKPAYSCFLWVNTRGQVVPLYPWNNDTVEVTDAKLQPPSRIATKVIISPTIGKGWVFDGKGGLETVVLLARTTPLGNDLRLGSHLESLPVPKMRHREERAVLSLDPGNDSFATVAASQRGPEPEAREVDRPLLERLAPLRDQFEVIRVIRFAHEGE